MGDVASRRVKTVLVIGAGRYQRPAIRRAKELGYRVVAADRNPDAPGLAEADVPLVVDFADVDAVLEAIAGLELDGVTTVQSDLAVPVVARIAAERGLPGIGVETARRMTSKVAMRQQLAEAGLPQPRFAFVRSSEEVMSALEQVGLPAVLKPGAGSGQRGLFRVESPQELEERLGEALAVSPDEPALLEEWVEGIELNGIVVLHADEARFVALCDRLRPSGRGFGVSWLHVYPPHLDGERRAEAERIAVAAAQALGLRTGIAFPQLLATADGRLLVIECAARIGGMMAEHLEHALGVDLLEAQLRLALGEELPSGLLEARREQPTAIRFLTAEPGMLRPGLVTRVGPLEPVLAAPGVVDASIYAQPGETIRPVTVISDRRGYVIAVGNSREEAVARADAAAALVEIAVEEAE